MAIPKIIFKEMSLEDNINIIKWAFYEKNGDLSIHDLTINYFKDLANLDFSLPRKEVYNKIEEVLTIDYNKYKERIQNEVKRYNSLWNEYNDKYFETLSSFLHTNWPSDLKVINATVGLIPVFPRYLDDYSFSVGIGIDNSKIIEVCAHETLHFLWFKKWKEIHPESPRREFDAPYLVWKYSEMVTDPILNNEPFSSMFGFTEQGYDSFYELKHNGSSVMNNLRKIYSDDISIEEKIDRGFKYVYDFFNN